MDALQLAAELCKRFEGLSLRPYFCPAHVATIGYGTTRYPSGRAVSISDPPITREQALDYLMWELRDKLPATLKLCPGLDTPARVAAILDFVYNLGSGNLKASTLRRKINAQDWPGAREQLTRWVYGGGKRLPGLVKRRAAEAAIV